MTDLTGYGRSTNGDAMFIDAGGGGGDHRVKYGIVGEEAKHQGKSLNGVFHVIGTANGDRIRASEGASDGNVFFGEGGDDWIDGVRGRDILDGGKGNDTLHGGREDDLLLGGKGDDSGADLLDGGAGIDTADYSDSKTAVQIDLAAGIASWGDAEGDRLVSIENLVGSRGADYLLADDSANVIAAGAGGDLVDGRGGNDILSGGAGGDGADYIDGGTGKDTLFGGASDDRLLGGTGDDRLEGGSGWDRLLGR